MSITRSSGGLGVGEGIWDSIRQIQKSGLRFMRRIKGAARSMNSSIAINSAPVAVLWLANIASNERIALSAPSRTNASRFFSKVRRECMTRLALCLSRSFSGNDSSQRRLISSLPAIKKSLRSCARSAAISPRSDPTSASVCGKARRSATVLRSGFASHCDQTANQRAIPVSMTRAPG